MSIPVGVLGGTGLVGQRLLALLDDHPLFKPASITASDERAGERYDESVIWRIDHDLSDSIGAIQLVRSDPAAVSTDVDLVLSALPGSVAADIETSFARSGAIVCSNASPLRLADDVPLVIPEINADHLKLIDIQREERGWDGAIVKNPNCMSTTVSLPMWAIADLGIERATIVTMQAISGAGTHGVNSIDIVDNILPDIPGEATKLSEEPLKILGTVEGGSIVPHEASIDAACHRVPVIDGHLATCFITVEEQTSASAVAEKLTSAPSVELPSAPERPILVTEAERRPQPRYDRNASDGMAVTVGPVDVDQSRIRFNCIAHNTIRGAAGACLLAAEAVVEQGYVS